MSDLRIENPAAVRHPVGAAAGGVFVVLCAVAAACAAVVPGRATDAVGVPIGWRWSPAVWLLLVALAAAGTVVPYRARWSRAAAAVALIVALQVAGRAVVMTRNWLEAHGTTGIAPGELADLVTAASLVAVAGFAAAVAATAVLWHEPASLSAALPGRPGRVALGVALAALMPVLWSAAVDGRIGWSVPVALMYALPWGAGLAVTGWLRGRTAAAALVTVAACVLLFLVFVGGDHLPDLFSPPVESD